MSRHSVSNLPRRHFLLRLLSAGLAVWALSVFASTARAESSVFETIAAEVKGVFEHSRGAIVKIEAVDDNGHLAGTGFFIDPNGTLYTSYTVGGESRDIVVCRGDAKYPATRLLGDARSGVAILKIQAQTPFLIVGSTTDTAVGTPVVAVGYPMDLPLSPNFGLIAGFDIKYLGRYFSTSHIRANLPVQRGEGGAPLLNLKGEVIGVLISGLDNGTGCFALPIQAAEKVRADYMRFGAARPGWLGLSVAGGPTSVEGSNAEVQELMDNTPAAKAGFQKGDILLKIGDKEIKAPEDALDAAFYMTAGDEVPIVVARGTERISIRVQAAERPGQENIAKGPLPLIDASNPPDHSHSVMLKNSK